MGTGYRNAANGSSFGNLYGLAYKYNGGAGGHATYQVQNGTATSGLGTNLWTTGSVLPGNGTVSAPAFSFASDTNTGIYRGGTDILKLVTAGADRLTVLANGNIGIGTTNPTKKLEVLGDVKITGILDINGSVNADTFGNISAQKFLDIGNTLYGLIPANTDPAKNSLSLTSTGSIKFNYKDTTASHIFTAAASRIQNYSNGLSLDVSSSTSGVVAWNSSLFLNTSGRIGLGTTAPAEKLDVYGKIALNGTQVLYRPTAIG
jgi:hypothetical protein